MRNISEQAPGISGENFRVIEDDHPRVDCAVVGVFAPGQDVAQLSLALLRGLINRGQESAGIAVANKDGLYASWGLGDVIHVFSDKLIWRGSNFRIRSEIYDRNHLPYLVNSHISIGHNRYGNTGGTTIENAGPFLIDDFALAHNGNLTNAQDLLMNVKNKGFVPRGTTDSEILTFFIALEEGKDWDEKIITGLRKAEGSYSLTMMTRDALYAAKDPMDNRPLSLGKIVKDGKVISWIVASEDSAIKNIGGVIERDIEPGELVKIDENGVQTINREAPKLARCPFEFLYFMKPDSSWLGKLVGDVRFQAGEWLYRDFPVEGAQAVTAFPYSAMLAAEGYSFAAGIPYLEAFYKDRWGIGRTFMLPDQKEREIGIAKYSVLTDLLRRLGITNLVAIDDSIVRGTTTGPLIKLLKDGIQGLKVHVRITFPEIHHPCFYAVDFGTYEELLRHKFPELSGAANFLGADSLAYSTLERIAQIIGVPVEELCQACNRGIYATKIPENQNKFYLQKPKSSG